MQIPEYKTVAGLILPEERLLKDEVRICISNTLEEECRAYAAHLEECGFSRHSAREIPAGSEKPYHVNLFYTYTREDMHIFVNWAASLGMVMITATPPQALPPQDKAEFCTVPTLTQGKITSGMLYMTQTADGSFILMDGGCYYEEDAVRLYDFMREKTPAGSRPRIAMWIFSHPDIDHIELATEFMRTYADKVEIDAFAYQFPDLTAMQFSYQDTAGAKADQDALEESIRTYYPGAVHYILRTGQVYTFSGVEMEILWTADMLYPYHFMTANDTSAAWRLRFDSGKTALFLGDCMQDACRRMAYTYGDYLKSDILQLAHHGLIGGEKGLYQLIDPEICFWATGKARFSGVLEGQKYQWCIGEGACDYNSWIRDDSIRKRAHYHNGEVTTIQCD